LHDRDPDLAEMKAFVACQNLDEVKDPIFEYKTSENANYLFWLLKKAIPVVQAKNSGWSDMW